MTGRIFDIKEFSVHDGPGIGVTVFMKGCPLRCKWCHNPEGLSFEKQMNSATGRIVGEDWTVDALCAYLENFKPAYDLSGGGVTFSGGEATAQPEFVAACADRLRGNGIQVVLDTSGHCDETVWRNLIGRIDMCYFDLKCIDSEVHKAMTGVGNERIIRNLAILSQSDARYRIRVPLVPEVSDTTKNKEATIGLVATLDRPPDGIDWLPFNKLSPAKYQIYGMEYGFGRAAGK